MLWVHTTTSEYEGGPGSTEGVERLISFRDGRATVLFEATLQLETSSFDEEVGMVTTSEMWTLEAHFDASPPAIELILSNSSKPDALPLGTRRRFVRGTDGIFLEQPRP